MTGACHSQLKPFTPSPVDFGSGVFDLAAAFNPLNPGRMIDYQVVSVRDGVAVFSVAMPDQMVGAFATMLESQGELFKFIDRKRRIKVAENKAIDLDAIAERQKYVEEYQRLIVETFDKLVRSGRTVNEAVKETNKRLKEQGHPWACYDNVMRVLRAGGRLRKSKKGGTLSR